MLEPAVERHIEPTPSLEACVFRELYDKETYEFDTADRWRLVITRYQGRAKPWNGDLLGEPVLLVHGFSQNRHAWTAGDFVKRLVYLGLDVHILELRGHGKSHRDLQLATCERLQRPLPDDFNYGWDFSDYFLQDVPAAIDAVKAKSGKKALMYVGHSMGGILGYGLAAQRRDIRGLMTLGSPLDIGAESRLLKAAARLEPVFPAIKWTTHALGKGLMKVQRWLPGTPMQPSHLNAVPMDALLGRLYQSLVTGSGSASLPRALKLFNPGRTRPQHIRWLFDEGEDKETFGVLRTFARWIQRREVVCYRSLFDFRQALSQIHVPLVVVYGTHDILAGERSTRLGFEKASSSYRVWKRLEGDGHIDLTVGDCTGDIVQELQRLLEHLNEASTG